MVTTKWYLTNVEDKEDALNFIGSPNDIPGMRVYYLKKNGKEERRLDYQGKTYTAKLRNLTQYDDVPCNNARCLRAKGPPDTCKCQCAGRHHGDFWKLLLDLLSTTRMLVRGSLQGESPQGEP